MSGNVLSLRAYERIPDFMLIIVYAKRRMELTFVAKARRWTLDVCLLSPIFLTAPADLAMFQSPSVLSARRWRLRMRSDPCPRRQMSPTDSPAPKRRVIFAVLLPMVLSLIVLPAIAFARPPDSAWIGGIYDGADGDDSVVLVYETAAPSVPNEPPPPLFCCLQNISIESTVHGLPDGR